MYFDESGTHHDSQVLTVSVAWATKSDWANWTVDWIRSKAPISVFHSVDCHNRKGEFVGWTSEKRDNYVKGKILPVIRRHYICSVVSAIDKRELVKTLEREHNIKIEEEHLIRGWYYICLRWAMRQSVKKTSHLCMKPTTTARLGIGLSRTSNESFQSAAQHSRLGQNCSIRRCSVQTYSLTRATIRCEILTSPVVSHWLQLTQMEAGSVFENMIPAKLAL
jgi:hypothetical protein